MASKKTLNAWNLEALGVEKLARLLMEIGTGNATAKRRIRLELAGTQSPDEVAREIRKRLTAIARLRSFVDWRQGKALAGDLETQRRAIVGQMAKADPVQAMDLMWRFLTLAAPVFERCDDSNGTVIGIFRAACRDLGEIAVAARIAPEALADRAFDALRENDYGQYDGLIEVLAPVLGRKGLDRLKALVTKLSKAPMPKPRNGTREAIGWGSSGPIYADDIAERSRDGMVRMALQAIADAQGDVDAFIAQQSDQARAAPHVAAQIAQRLLAAGRVDEAWSAINAAGKNQRGPVPFEWEQAYVDVLAALGRDGDAQTFRRESFERSLSETHLRSYLKHLPDFEDVEAEERALSHAQRYPNVHQSLAFLVSWPAIDRAAQLVLTRAGELDGNYYELLSPAADKLEAKHPLAATILRRAMIDFALRTSRVKRYRHAARHLLECASLATAIKHFGTLEPHAAYVARLRAEHGRKEAFWSLVP